MLDHSIPTWSPVKLSQNKVHHEISWILSQIFQHFPWHLAYHPCVFPGVFHSFPPFPPFSRDQPIGQHQASSPSAPRHGPPADRPRHHLRGLLVFLGKNQLEIEVINYKPYGSKHCLRRYLSLQIIVNYTPKKVLNAIWIYPRGSMVLEYAHLHWPMYVIFQIIPM